MTNETLETPRGGVGAAEEVSDAQVIRPIWTNPGGPNALAEAKQSILESQSAVDGLLTPDVVDELKREHDATFPERQPRGAAAFEARKEFREGLTDLRADNGSSNDDAIIAEVKKSRAALDILDQPFNISEMVRQRLQESGKRFFANDNISDFLKAGELELMKEEVAAKFKEVLKALVIDIDNDHNTKETCDRVSKMFCDEIFSGRFEPKPTVTGFPNDSNYDQLYVSGPITIRSTCAHHFMPIKGKAYIGVFPGKNVIGLSKFNRLADWVASRPQIQEEMTVQIADIIEKETQAEGVAVLIQAEHFCLTHRGFKEHESDMATSVMRGVFREDVALKQEFLQIVSRMK